MASQQREHGSQQNITQERLATGLGWFSIGLGLAEIAAPSMMAQLIGMEDTKRTRTLLRTYGARELAAGIGILSQPRPAGWMWSRVAGDVMDLATLGSALSSDDTNRTRAATATAAVLGVTALDVICGQQLSRASSGISLSSSIRVARSTIIDRSPEELYQFWRNFENLPTFMDHLESVQVLDNGRSHWKAKAPAGMTVEWDAEITGDHPGSAIAWRSLPDADVDNAGLVRFERATGGRGTIVKVELNYSPPGGKLGALFAKLFGEEPNQQLEDDLRAFKQVMETGEVLQSDATVYPGMHPAQPPAKLPPTVPALR